MVKEDYIPPFIVILQYKVQTIVVLSYGEKGSPGGTIDEDEISW